ncbi:ankyrin repeat domain-containing protein 9-like [Bufo gargarizans]|uniref:ankyrin repeat domain-containing protein 9-like n=1 Tax=Bufo gargarizans TaxID=30331 RepID=UPI001CF3132B|nr:ankyrin repeat domain-containing protein 9-like [Bufo gargarizans]
MKDIQLDYIQPSDIFHLAIKNREPVWKLESLRAQVYFDWEVDPEDRRYSPSSGLFYAVIHNNIQYARYLLSHFPKDSIKVPGFKRDQCPRYAFHLGLAITYNRQKILSMIIETCQKDPVLQSYINLEIFFYPMEGKTPLHLACELLRSDLVLTLLCHGASSRADDLGQTPMDVILTHLWSSKDNMKPKIQCLDYLLLFTLPGRLQMSRTLQENREYWETLLGDDIYNYLLGLRPAPLGLMSMKKVLQQLPPSKFLISIQQLPIPQSMKNRFTLGY